jgi:hypothetical protein
MSWKKSCMKYYHWKASIQGEKIVNNNLQLDRLKFLLNEVLIALSSSKNNTNNTIRLHDLKYWCDY